MNSSTYLESKNLVLFFIITFAWSWLLWIPQVLDTMGFEINIILLFLGNLAVFGPSVSAIIVTGIASGKDGIKKLLKKGWKHDFKKIWLFPIFIIIPVISFLSLLMVILIEGDWVLNYGNPFTMFFPILFIIFFTGGPLAEEFGWRGFALDRLQSRWNALISSLILGLIWGVWHLPLHFIAGTTQEVIPFYQNLIIIMLSSVIYTWLHNNTGGSVLVAMLFHLTSNMSGAYIPYWISDVGRWMSFTFTLIVVAIILIIYGPKKLKKNQTKLD